MLSADFTMPDHCTPSYQQAWQCLTTIHHVTSKTPQCLTTTHHANPTMPDHYIPCFQQTPQWLTTIHHANPTMPDHYTPCYQQTPQCLTTIHHATSKPHNVWPLYTMLPANITMPGHYTSCYQHISQCLTTIHHATSKYHNAWPPCTMLPANITMPDHCTPCYQHNDLPCIQYRFYHHRHEYPLAAMRTHLRWQQCGPFYCGSPNISLLTPPWGSNYCAINEDPSTVTTIRNFLLWQPCMSS